MIISIVKIFFIFIVPLILVLIIRTDHHKTYEFVDSRTRRMVAPSIPYPYISSLFSDILLKIGISPYSFCIENNSYSQAYSLPHDLAVRLDNASDFIKIPYKDKKCTPILKKDIFYDVAWGGFVIPNKEWAQKYFKCENGKCSLNFKIDEVLNFTVYSKLSFPALIIIYTLLVAAMFGFFKFSIEIYNFLK